MGGEALVLHLHFAGIHLPVAICVEEEHNLANLPEGVIPSVSDSSERETLSSSPMVPGQVTRIDTLKLEAAVRSPGKVTNQCRSLAQYLNGG